MQSEDITISQSLILWLIGGIIGVFSTLMGLIWRRHTADIDGLKTAIAKAVPFETYETNRKEMREGIIDLHEKVEKIDEKAQERHGKVMEVLLELKGTRSK